MMKEAKRTRIRKNSLPEENLELNDDTLNNIDSLAIEHTVDQVTFGWENAMCAAAELWQQGNMKLLEGDLVLAFKNTGNTKTGLHQVIVVKYFSFNGISKVYTGDYGVSVITSTYSYTLPHVTKDYIEVLLGDLTSYKIENSILNKLKSILENEIISN